MWEKEKVRVPYRNNSLYPDGLAGIHVNGVCSSNHLVLGWVISSRIKSAVDDNCCS